MALSMRPPRMVIGGWLAKLRSREVGSTFDMLWVIAPDLKWTAWANRMVYTIGGPSSNKCHASSNRCLTSSNKKLLVTSASLLVTSALLVVTRSY